MEKSRHQHRQACRRDIAKQKNSGAFRHPTMTRRAPGDCDDPELFRLPTEGRKPSAPGEESAELPTSRVARFCRDCKPRLAVSPHKEKAQPAQKGWGLVGSCGEPAEQGSRTHGQHSTVSASRTMTANAMPAGRRCKTKSPNSLARQPWLSFSLGVRLVTPNPT